MLEIKFSGRGGQGVVVASRILGLSYFKAGKYPQCYSLFGGERRGAPVVGFLRVDDKKILLKCEIKQPKSLICLDESLFDAGETREQLKPGGAVLINTPRSLEALSGLQGFQVGRVDAAAISESAGLGGIINTAMLGAYCRMAGTPELDFLLDSVSEMVPAKSADANREAVRTAYHMVELAEGCNA
jgi:2-oxoacid:acceptor oxidoreductase gamma subunit (pyruvate/2-ketoisovalerate family)